MADTTKLMGTRADNGRVVRKLHAQGLLHREIQEITGLSRSYISSLINDPTGEAEKKRKQSYAGVCEDCGGPTYGGDGPAMARMICQTCYRIRQHETRYWTKARIVERIREFAAENGRPPNASEWVRTDFEKDYPSTSVVQYVFGYWADAVEAAGFERPRLGGGFWTREAIIEAIQDDSYQGVAMYDQSLAPVARYHFGSWVAAVHAAGLLTMREAASRDAREREAARAA